jgi:hypothetical protein
MTSASDKLQPEADSGRRPAMTVQTLDDIHELAQQLRVDSIRCRARQGTHRCRARFMSTRAPDIGVPSSLSSPGARPLWHEAGVPSA